MDDLILGAINHADDLGKADDFSTLASQMEQYTQPHESCEVEGIKKVGKCNLRKSLAWDAAFFTSAGFLDADELSSMIEGGSSSKKQLLPSIEEDIYRSTDSLSTLGSENLTLESLEVDLFEDIRASIQNSSRAFNRANSIKDVSGDAGTEIIYSLTEDLASKNEAKSRVGPKKHTSLTHTPRKLNMQRLNSPLGSHSTAGTQVPMESVKKETKVNGRPIRGPPAAAGRSAMRSNQVQLENDKPKAVGKAAPVSKVPGFNNSQRTVPKPLLPSKSSSSSSSTATKKDPPKVSSSSDSSTSSVSAYSNPKKIISKSIYPTKSSNSILKPPSKLPTKEKRENNLRASKLSSNISPASSISEWSVASSSSTSSVNQFSKTAPINNIRKSTDRVLDRNEKKVFHPNNEKLNAASAQRGAPHKPATAKPLVNREKINSASTLRGPPTKPAPAKPSGLRLPSPKIGFFDGVKPVVHTPNGSSQSRSGVPSSTKIGPSISTPTGVSAKEKSPKIQPIRLIKPVGNIKLDTKKSVSPLPSKKLNSTKVHNSPKNVETPLVPPLTYEETDEEKFFKSQELCKTNGGDTKKSASPLPSKKSNASTKVHISPKNKETPLIPPLTHEETDEEKFLKSQEAEIIELCKTNGGETEKINLVDVDIIAGANLVNIEIIPVAADIYDCKVKKASEEKSDDSEIITEKNNKAALICDGELDENMSANLVKSEIFLVSGNMNDCKGKMVSEEKSEKVKSITENYFLADLKSEINIDEKLNAESVKLKIDPVDGEIYDFEGGKVPEENKKVPSISENISPADENNHMKLDIKMSDGEIYHCEGKMASPEKNNDMDFITEKISAANLKKDTNLDFEPQDGEIFVCDEKMAFFEETNDFKSAEKENQVRGLSLDICHGYSENDKKSSINFICSPREKKNQISETISSARTPFTDKNAPCNDDRGGISSEICVGGMEKIAVLPSLECPLDEN